MFNPPGPIDMYRDETQKSTQWTHPFSMSDSKRWWLNMMEQFARVIQPEYFKNAKALPSKPMPIPLTIAQSDKGVEPQEEEEGVI